MEGGGEANGAPHYGGPGDALGRRRENPSIRQYGVMQGQLGLVHVPRGGVGRVPVQPGSVHPLKAAPIQRW
ncbi:hypothetical protein Stube_12270 [Streptomyces tubercidicus]|uniref:Uncharacterized protein n=1 Tax=Streptomyces tubercidicus TaxID=47759 RepID=A0A640UMH2_9ACTN|nr:hypothetical protein Stube_12270 [Streptomyces tubercidicus]